VVVVTRGREAGEHQSFLVVVFAEYLVVTQIVAVTHTEPVHTQQSSSYPAHACSVR